jgi:hypothetical protein
LAVQEPDKIQRFNATVERAHVVRICRIEIEG